MEKRDEMWRRGEERGKGGEERQAKGKHGRGMVAIAVFPVSVVKI